MSPPPPTATTNEASADDAAWQGIDISKVLRSQGPVVTCVVLRAAADNDNAKQEKKKQANSNDNDETELRDLKEHLVEEIRMDTTPKKNEVETILGGPFSTFLYSSSHDCGVVAFFCEN